jgi:AraC-like DNA-binding protein
MTESNLSKILGFAHIAFEPRIAFIVNALLRCPDDSRRAQDWAQEIGLSSSRFQHLFKEDVGHRADVDCLLPRLLPPRQHRHRYDGVLAPNAAHRSRVVSVQEVVKPSHLATNDEPAAMVASRPASTDRVLKPTGCVQ